MIEIQITEKIASLDNASLGMLELLEQAALKTLKYTHSDLQDSLTIVLTDDQELRSLNQQYLGIDAATDVLSFPGGDIDPDTQTLYLGDVVISFPRALAQAHNAGHSVEAEMQLLVVHGVLHLLGYDHETADQKAHMWAAQAHILQAVGCTITAPSQTTESDLASDE